MDGSTQFSLERVCMMLCIALTLVFAGTTAAGVIDRIQHQPGAPAIHQHFAFSTVVLDSDDHHDVDDPHADHGQADDQDGNDRADHQSGSGHHHHGDNSSGLPAFAAAEPGLIDPGGSRHGLAPVRPAVGLTLHGPERPPKAITIDV